MVEILLYASLEQQKSQSQKEMKLSKEAKSRTQETVYKP